MANIDRETLFTNGGHRPRSSSKHEIFDIDIDDGEDDEEDEDGDEISMSSRSSNSVIVPAVRPSTAAFRPSFVTSSRDKERNRERAFKIYGRRWYILFLHTLVGLGQVMVYTTWGPIEVSATKGLGFTQTDLAMLPSWYDICYLISIIPFMWLIQRHGLRTAELLTAVIVVLGASVRCFTFNDEWSDRIFIHLGTIINGIGAPIPWIGCTYISAFWFPINERSLSTSIGVSAAMVGQAFSFVVGPELVGYFAPDTDPANPASPQEVRQGIRKLLYFECLYCQIILLMVILYFPSKPPTPPSFTASVERTSFWRSIPKLLKNGQVWLTMFVYAVSTSVYSAWHQVLTIFLEPAMSETDAGWVGFVMCIVGIIASPILVLLAKSCIDRHPKLVCTISMSIGCGCIGLLTAAAFFVNELFTPPVIWSTILVSSACFTAVEPLWWEMACEAAYPVSESVVSGMFTLASCAISWLYFLLYMFPQLGTNWATWSMLICEIIVVPVFLFYKPSFKRTLEDQKNERINEFEMKEIKPVNMKIV